MTAEETLLKIQSEKAEVQKMLAEMKSNVEAMKKRRRIYSYQVLVFRDAGNDKRYIM